MPASPVVQDVAVDALAARAIDRVLQAERDAREAVKACDRACAKMLEYARRKARSIHERADARSSALHARAAKNLELCAAALMEQRMKTAAEAVRQLSDPVRLSTAIERLAAGLTTEAASSDAA